MPAWNEILNETKQTGSAYDVIRRKYLGKLYGITKRNVILYYSGWLQKPELIREPGITIGIADADKNGFMSVIHQLNRGEGLDLILHTPGGDMAATESLVEYIKSMFGNDVRAIVPQLAMSGGTIMALACKEIWMGKESSIGPIDPQFGGTPATGLLKEFQRIASEIKEDPTMTLLWRPILDQIKPGFITECEDAISWSRDMARKFLEENMFQGNKDKEKISENIVNHLTERSSAKSHGRHIGIQEAKLIFHDNVKSLEDSQEFQDAVLTLHHATIVSLEATPCYKIIENHTGRAFIKQIRSPISI